MEDESQFRFTLSSVALFLAGAVSAAAMAQSDIVTSKLHDVLSWISLSIFNIDDIVHVFSVYFDKIVYALAFTLIEWQFRFVRTILTKILRKFLKILSKPDDQMLGEWYVSRYFKKHSIYTVETDVWNVSKTFSGTYSVKTSQSDAQHKTSGSIIYNERDRVNMLLNGENHKQQSFIAFKTNIARDGDSRMIGIGAGDDAQYDLCARIYLASRNKYPALYVKNIIDDVTQTIINKNYTGMLRFSVDDISEVFSRHPVPDIQKRPTRVQTIVEFFTSTKARTKDADSKQQPS